jgi:hypothetical protein
LYFCENEFVKNCRSVKINAMLHGIFYVFLSLKSSRNFGPHATLTNPAVHILSMAIPGGCVPK